MKKNKWIICIVMLFSLLSGMHSEGAVVYFEENFVGKEIDSTKWDTDNATSGKRVCWPDWWGHPEIWQWQDVSVEPCRGYVQPLPYGSITLDNGEANFKSGYSLTFPYISTGPPNRPNPFPDSGDFTLEVKIKYKTPWTFYIGGFSAGIFHIWGYQAGLSSPSVQFPITNSSYHVYRLEYVNQNYSLYIDDALKFGPTQNNTRPQNISLGWAGIVATGPNNWSDFTVDFIRVTVPNNPPSALEAVYEEFEGSTKQS